MKEQHAETVAGHQCFVTRNTEYYMRNHLCFAVKDRRTDTWLEGHLAVGRTLAGGVRVLDSGEAIPVTGAPQVGEALYFADQGPELITSVLCRIDQTEAELPAGFLG